MPVFWVAVLGLVGVFSRYFIDQITMRWSIHFPVGTLFINLLGSLAAGIIYVLGVERAAISPDIRTGILVGFLGGFTTFSAFSLQAAKLVEEGSAGLGLLYLGISPVFGILFALGGMALTRAWFS